VVDPFCSSAKNGHLFVMNPISDKRRRTLWMGSIQPEWTPDYVSSLFDTSVTVTIKCNARKGWVDEFGRKVGFALIEFARPEEADRVLRDINGREISGASCSFDLKPHSWAREAQVSLPELDPSKLLSGAVAEVQMMLDDANEPPLESQLEPLTLCQMRERLAAFGFETSLIEQQALRIGGRVAKKRALVDLLCGAYRRNPAQFPRSRTHHAGEPISESITFPLLDILRSTAWAPKKRNVTAAEYLVLGVPAQGAQPKNLERYPELWRLACALMQAMAPSFRFSSLAVTKNFVGSPHVDAGDKTWQYAVSLGDFTSGGQLCVEVSANEVGVIETKNRLCRFDGRFPHWVRSYEGERFSLIFYRVDGEVTPKEKAVW
jgi:hypothetical protein